MLKSVLYLHVTGDYTHTHTHMYMCVCVCVYVYPSHCTCETCVLHLNFLKCKKLLYVCPLFLTAMLSPVFFHVENQDQIPVYKGKGQYGLIS